MLSFDSIAFGPIHSRRLGSSLGINLLPASGKLCNFDCIYCECGWNKDSAQSSHTLPTFLQVRDSLEAKFSSAAQQGTPVDSITFSGNGEPTLHPYFPEIIDTTIQLRDTYLPSSKITVLSNATTLFDGRIVEALKKIDNPVLKLDAPTDAGVSLVNRPTGHYNVEKVVENLCRFEGNFILQTMFLHGALFDFALDREGLGRWMDIVRRTTPRLVMVYTLDRETPMKGLGKMSVEEMEQLTALLTKEGFKVQING